jgi:hypothetical protein
MDVNVKVTIERLDDLTQAVTMLAMALAHGKGYNELAEVAPEKPTKAPKADKPAPAAEKAPEVTEEAPKETKPETKVTIEDVRAALAGPMAAGKQAEIKALFAEFGASKLPEVAKTHYAALIEKAKGL